MLTRRKFDSAFRALVAFLLVRSVHNAATDGLDAEAAIHRQQESAVDETADLDGAGWKGISARDRSVSQLRSFQVDVEKLTSVVGESTARHLNKTVSWGQRHPLVFYPGYGTSLLHVKATGQARESCPTSAEFNVGFGQFTLLDGVPEACVYPMLQMQYDAATGAFANAPGVETSIYDFGGQFCAPLPYEPLFAVAQAIGYTSDVGTDGPHLERAQQLVESAYTNSGGLPVYLVGHSNGPLYALALLRSMTAEWRAKYIAGLISYAGNWVGQGVNYNQLFSGASLFDDSVYPSSAPAYESWPSTYMSAASPAYFGSSEVVIRAFNATGAVLPSDYTPADALRLFKDAGLAQAQVLGPLLLGNFSSDRSPPHTHFYGFIGTEVRTQVGTSYATLKQEQEPLGDAAIYSANGGDGNQEHADNVAVTDWAHLQDPCFHYELNREEGATHTRLPFEPSVIKRTVQILFTAPAQCGYVGTARVQRD